MPTESKVQFRMMQGICHGTIKPPGGLTREKACEFVKGQSPKDLPERKTETSTRHKRPVSYPKPK